MNILSFLIMFLFFLCSQKWTWSFFVMRKDLNCWARIDNLDSIIWYRKTTKDSVWELPAGHCSWFWKAQNELNGWMKNCTSIQHPISCPVFYIGNRGYSLKIQTVKFINFLWSEVWDRSLEIIGRKLSCPDLIGFNN